MDRGQRLGKLNFRSNFLFSFSDVTKSKVAICCLAGGPLYITPISTLLI